MKKLTLQIISSPANLLVQNNSANTTKSKLNLPTSPVLSILPTSSVLPILPVLPTSPVLSILPTSPVSTSSRTLPSSTISDHSCYIIKSISTGRLYIGYTLDFTRRLRQHNGEIVGGAKRTSKGRPWTPICIIKGFLDNSSALRFEYRLQHNYKGRPSLAKILDNLKFIIKNGDGSIQHGNKLSWPHLHIIWYDKSLTINENQVTNYYP